MAKASDAPGPISEESIGYLEDVKKGKPRKFAMICKGTSVVSLVVYKKGNVEKRRKEAKESGKGQFYFGVVDGKGMDIRFVLARADGFESAPVKTASLKGFLDESAELKCKPYFEIVDAAPVVLDEDDPLVARFLALQERALQACEAHPDRAAEINTLCRQIGSYLDQDQPDQATLNLESLETLLNALNGATTPNVSPPPADDGLAAKLIEALKGLKSLLERAIAQHPNRKAELIASFTQIRDEIKNQQLAQAQASFDGLEKLLQSLVASPVASSTETQPQVSDEMAQWKEKVAAWGPAIKTAIAAKGPDAAEMMKLLSQASALSKPGGDLVQAIAKLTECYALATTNAPLGDPGAQFNSRLKALIPAIKAVAGTPIGDEAKTLASQAGGFAGNKDYGQANYLLDRVQELVKTKSPTEAATSTANPAETRVEGAESQPELVTSGLVKYRTALLNYRSERAKVMAQLQSLYEAVVGALPEQAEMAEKLIDRLENTFSEIDDAIDDAINAANSEREPYNEATRSLLRTFLSELRSDRLIKQADNNPFVKVSVEATLVGALTSIEKTMV